MQNAVVFGGGGVGIDVRNTHACYIKFDYMRISREKYWYDIRDELYLFFT